MMNITVNEQIELRLFDSRYATEYFESIRSSKNNGEAFFEAIQKKYESIEKVTARIEDAIENKFKVDGTPDFFIFYGGKVAGVFEFHPMSSGNFIEVGFWLFPEFRGKGILAQAFPRLVEYAGTSFTKSKIIATTAVSNGPAQKLLERIGFKKTVEVEESLKDGTLERQFLYEMVLPKATQ
jgi:ribosomal-protein-alanine N-acetyltransferase